MAIPKLLHEWDCGDYHVRVIVVGDRLVLERRCGEDTLGAPLWRVSDCNRGEYAEAAAYATYIAVMKRVDELKPNDESKPNG